MIKEAIKFLTDRGWKVYDNGTVKQWEETQRWLYRRRFQLKPKAKVNFKKKETYFRLWLGDWYRGTFTSREVIKRYQGCKKHHSIISKLVKSGNGKSRASTKNAMRQENFDVISPREEVKMEDRWVYD